MLCPTCNREWGSEYDRCPSDGAVLAQRAPSVVGSTTGQLALATDGADATDELVAGTVVGEYVIEKRIGHGGMGVVYAARHPLIGKRAAIKVLNAKYSADQVAVDRFVLEAQAVNQIAHANIVDVFSFGALEDGRSYFAMELLRGETLHARLERAPMSAAEATPIIVALSRALEAAHTAGVIHRDLKPENVFLVSEDDTVRVKLLDFGIAKLSGSTGVHVSRTATGIAMGTPLFMSPEQARGLDVDARTDMYSLGVLAYQMICRVTPFDSEASAVEVLTAHIAKAPRPPSQWVPDVPPTLEAIILELLAKQPSDRPSLQDVRRRLTRLATDPVVAAPGPRVAGPEMQTLLQGTGFSHQVSTSRPPQLTVTSDALEPPRRRRTARWIAVGALAAAGLVAVVFARHGASSSAETSTRTATSAPPATLSVSPTPAPITPPSEPPKAVTPPMPSVGTLELEAYPPTATVTVDGNRVALVRGKARVDLAPGSHILESTAPGHRPFKDTLEIAQSRTTSSVIRLRPRAGSRPTTVVEPDTDAVVDPFAKGSKQKP